MEREVYNQIYKIKMIKNNKVGNNNDNKDRDKNDNIDDDYCIIIRIFVWERSSI